ncbi:MAG: DUF922 domain-containing protein [Gammaproteobacteria bacterium]|nr:DUF922 domain-containing protein [Gammaproteobacteria bacterium]
MQCLIRFWPFWAVLLPFSTLAHVSENSTTEYYDLRATAPLALRYQLSLHGPKDHRGKRFHGMARSRLRWSYEKIVNRQGCRVVSVTVVLDQHYTLPNWVNKDQAHVKWQKQWARYHRALTAHEHQHGFFARQTAHKIDQNLLNLSQPNCQKLQLKVEKITADLMAELREKNRRYDALSWHGVWEGVIFPRLKKRKW